MPKDSVLHPHGFEGISLDVLKWQIKYPYNSYYIRANDRGLEKLNEFFHVLDNTIALPEDQRLDAMYFIVQALGVMFGRSHHCGFARLKKGFEELLRFQYRTEIFERVDAPIGKPVIDINSKYVPTK